MHVIAAKAVAFGEALKPEFKAYAQQVIHNARALANTLLRHGFDLISGGTDSHLMLVDLTKRKVNGKDTCHALEEVNITCNKNGIPHDPLPPMITSGIRLGSPAATTRGFKEEDFVQIGHWIAEVTEDLANGKEPNPTIKEAIVSLCAAYPIYPDLRYV